MCKIYALKLNISSFIIFKDSFRIVAVFVIEPQWSVEIIFCVEIMKLVAGGAGFNPSANSNPAIFHICQNYEKLLALRKQNSVKYPGNMRDIIVIRG